MRIFPKVTRDLKELVKDFTPSVTIFYSLEWFCVDNEAWYSEEDGGIIWIKNRILPIILLHELGHHIGFNLHLPRFWHLIIENLF